MNRFWKDMGIAIIMGWIVPAILLSAVISFSGESQEIQVLTEPIITTENAAATEVDIHVQVSVLNADGEVSQMPLQAYLHGVVLAEMPVSFEDEALKAQAVVSRTYTMRAIGGASKHEGADVCADSACCQGYMDIDHYLKIGGTQENLQRIQTLIDETDGEVLTFDGELIEATYFSCSGGTTEDAVAVWGTDVPYLRSVVSPGEEEATHYADSATFTLNEFQLLLDHAVEGNPQEWFSDVTYTAGGGVETMLIGGEVFSGTQLRQLLGLKSTAFTIEVKDEAITIHTRGYGHRVGMSQYGANAMAAAGSTYTQILAHYYRGTELVTDVD